MARRASPFKPLTPQRRRSPLTTLIVGIGVALLALIAALWFLSTLAREQPLTRIEQPVANEALIR